MKTQRISVTAIRWVTVFLVVLLVPGIAMAEAMAGPNEQRMVAAMQGALESDKIPSKGGQDVDSKDHEAGRAFIKACGVRANALPGKGCGTAWSTPDPDRTQYLTAALGPDDMPPIIAVPPQAASTDDGPKSYIPPYEERKRIAVPDTFGAGGDCHAAAYEAVTAEYLEFLDIAAWLCFSCNKGNEARTCLEARSSSDFHQFVDTLKIVPIFRDRQPQEGILFIARHTAGGSGWCKFVTLWIYSKECGQFVNVLPEILIRRSDEFKFLTDRKRKLGGVLILAEYAPTQGQSFADLCSYRIKIYRYRHKENKFKPVPGGEFVTEKKYLFKLEGYDTTEIIDDEMEKIQRVLRNKS